MYKTFFYPYPSFAQRLSVLNHLVQKSDFLTLVIGEQGSGKTTLLNEFLASAAGNLRLCCIQGHRLTKTHSLLAHIAQCLGIRASVPHTMFRELEKRITQFAKNHQLLVFLLDDAHVLTISKLQFLLKFAKVFGGKRKLIRIVLFCDPQIKINLAALEALLPQEVGINKLYVHPLKEKETADYLSHRLQSGAINGNVDENLHKMFSKDAIKAIHRYSGGYPRMINILADNTLRIGYGVRKRRIRARVVEEAFKCISASNDPAETGSSVLTT